MTLYMLQCSENIIMIQKYNTKHCCNAWGRYDLETRYNGGFQLSDRPISKLQVIPSMAVKGSRTSGSTPKELGTGQADDFRISTSTSSMQQKPLALEGRVDADFVGEGIRLDTDPENDFSGGLVVANTDGICWTSPPPSYTGWRQSQVVLPDVVDLMIPHDSKLLALWMRL